MKNKKWLILLLAILGTELVGGLSGLLAGDIRGMYEGFTKIPLAPPGGLFGIVWPLLYLLMGVSLYLIIITPAKKSTKLFAYGIYGLQLFLNFTWSLVFFGGDQMFFAIFNILALDLLVLCQIIYYKKISKWAAYLLVPYLMWILFATYLNIGFALVN